MKNLNIPKTVYTPGIQADSKTGIIEISGKSYPENTAKFYLPILDWIEEFIKTKEPGVTVTFEIEYFNSATTKIFYTIFDLLEEGQKKGKPVVVNWAFDPENESAVEAGEDFKEDFDSLAFNLINNQE